MYQLQNCVLLGTLSLCGIPPLACFWSKDEILNDSWLYSPIFAIIAWSTAGLTAFYMFRIYLLTFEGHLNVHFQTYSGKKKSPFYSISLWGKEGPKVIKKKNSLLALLTMNNNQRTSFFCKKTYRIDSNVTSITQPFSTISRFGTKNTFSYPHESDNTMLFPMLVLVLFTLFIGVIGILSSINSIKREGFGYIIKIVNPDYKPLHQNHKNSVDWYEFMTNATFSRCVLPGPLVLGKGPLNALTPTPDMDRTVSRRSEPSSRTALMGEQPNPWNILQPQVAKSRHRGAKPSRRCELLGKISLLSLE
ncbi:hypothetical protein FNV43_RR05834 [Rhamnella rubrinervis]|uniref:NAD(P)H-quinone oxidoreductase subunit 5, chloroplastic n=1 Tax=Rhamnella rubrinervis TaxID=2594499 RepID=A0A8K0HCB1_9ROSA|nr:hypothetical protein FNV43_RR05834 [Rhamnella rubrinervis]